MKKLLLVASLLITSIALNAGGEDGCYNQRVDYIENALRSPAEDFDKIFMQNLQLIAYGNPILAGDLKMRGGDNNGKQIDLAARLAGVIQRGCIKKYAPNYLSNGYDQCVPWVENKDRKLDPKKYCGQ